MLNAFLAIKQKELIVAKCTLDSAKLSQLEHILSRSYKVLRWQWIATYQHEIDGITDDAILLQGECAYHVPRFAEAVVGISGFSYENGIICYTIGAYRNNEFHECGTVPQADNENIEMLRRIPGREIENAYKFETVSRYVKIEFIDYDGQRFYNARIIASSSSDRVTQLGNLWSY